VQISVDGTGKNQLAPGQKGVGDVHMLSIFFTGKKSLIKTSRCAGALL